VSDKCASKCGIIQYMIGDILTLSKYCCFEMYYTIIVQIILKFWKLHCFQSLDLVVFLLSV